MYYCLFVTIILIGRKQSRRASKNEKKEGLDEQIYFKYIKA